MILNMIPDFSLVEEEKKLKVKDGSMCTKGSSSRENEEESKCALTSSSESYGEPSPANLMLVISCYYESSHTAPATSRKVSENDKQ
jgi:hypothetical protein